MKRCKKIAIISIFAVLILSFSLKNISQKKVLGFYYIEDVISNNGKYYVIIDNLDRGIKLRCTQDEHNLVIEHRNDIFLIEFIYNEYCPSTGKILTIAYDKYLSESVI